MWITATLLIGIGNQTIHLRQTMIPTSYDTVCSLCMPVPVNCTISNGPASSEISGIPIGQIMQKRYYYESMSIRFEDPIAESNPLFVWSFDVDIMS